MCDSDDLYNLVITNQPVAIDCKVTLVHKMFQNLRPLKHIINANSNVSISFSISFKDAS